MATKTYKCLVLNAWDRDDDKIAQLVVYSPGGNGFVTMTKDRVTAHFSKQPLIDPNEFNLVYAIVHTPNQARVELTIDQLRLLKNLAATCGSVQVSRNLFTI